MRTPSTLTRRRPICSSTFCTAKSPVMHATERLPPLRFLPRRRRPDDWPSMGCDSSTTRPSALFLCCVMLLGVIHSPPTVSSSSPSSSSCAGGRGVGSDGACGWKPCWASTTVKPSSVCAGGSDGASEAAAAAEGSGAEAEGSGAGLGESLAERSWSLASGAALSLAVCAECSLAPAFSWSRRSSCNCCPVCVSLGEHALPPTLSRMRHVPCVSTSRAYVKASTCMSAGESTA